MDDQSSKPADISPQTLPKQPEAPRTPTISSPSRQEKGSKKTILLLVGLLFIMLAASVGYLTWVNNKPGNTAGTNGFTKLSLPNEPAQKNNQFSARYFASGYVKYDAASLKEVDGVLPKIEPLLAKSGDSADREVVFLTDLTLNSPSKRLLMYDLAAGKTYLIDQDNDTEKSISNFYNARIMSDHFVVYAELSQSDPMTSTTAIKSLDLETGKTATILQGTTANVPIDICCAVSDDGLRMVIPQNDALLVYQAGSTTPTPFDAGVKVFPTVKGSDNDPYAAAQRNGRYPAIRWLDNQKIMFAKSNPLQWTVDKEDSHAAEAANGLAIYDLSTGKTTDVSATEGKVINWFVIDGKKLVFSALDKGLSGLTVYKLDDYTSAGADALKIAGVDDYQSGLFYDQAGKQLYIQPSGSSPQADTTTMQQLDIATGKDTSKKIGEFAHPRIEGVIAPDKLIINDNFGADHNYNIYDSKTGSVRHLFSFSGGN